MERKGNKAYRINKIRNPKTGLGGTKGTRKTGKGRQKKSVGQGQTRRKYA